MRPHWMDRIERRAEAGTYLVGVLVVLIIAMVAAVAYMTGV